MRTKTTRPGLLCVLALSTALVATDAGDAAAFTHVVSQGETLAQIAITFYGTPRFETALVGANALDAHRASAIVPGQPLEIPAPAHYRVETNQTWAELARVHLGDAKRAETLAHANGSVSWVQPSKGQEIEIPAVIAHIAAEDETVGKVAQRYLGDANKGWELDAYNGRKGDQKLSRGEVILVPLTEISLTEEGKKAARLAALRGGTEAGGQVYEAQRKAEAALPSLLADVRGGRYLDALGKGNRLLGTGELTRPQLTVIHRALLDAYVALDAQGLAAASCLAWRNNASPSEVQLDPRMVSPKVRAACGAR